MADLESPASAALPGTLLLVLPDGTRVPIDQELTIGRGEGVSVKISDPTVSRMHARISTGPSGPLLEDAGSRYGTMLAGQLLSKPEPLAPGSDIRLGVVRLTVEGELPHRAPRLDALDPGAGETISVPVGATAMGLRPPPTAGGLGPGIKPRVRSGWALKRLGAEEGEKRFVLREMRSGTFLRMDSEDAGLFELIDGQHSVPELLAEAERRLGPSGPGRLARLLAELGDRGLLDGVAPAPAVPRVAGGLDRLFKPHEKTFDWVGDVCQRAYASWGFHFFSLQGATFLVLLALAGFGAFAYLIGARYGTPFVVANRLLLGGAVFVLGRFGLVAIHELAHGMALEHYKRKVGRGGVRILFIFPYAFVDTSESYLEPRQHRMVISAAGPLSDVSMGALFSFLCAAWPAGAVREVFFQLAFAAYVGALFNLNPFLDRDGYHILVDVLREPGLRERARRQFAQELSGAAPGDEGSSVLGRYAIFGVLWSILAAAFVIGFSTRYYHQLVALAPEGVVLTVFVAFAALLLLPVAVTLGLPLWSRLRYGTAEVNRVVG
jgi:putative peptide zinc metalloprotease protein